MSDKVDDIEYSFYKQPSNYCDQCDIFKRLKGTGDCCSEHVPYPMLQKCSWGSVGYYKESMPF